MLKEDVRKFVIKPYQVMAVLKKKTKEEKYGNVIYINKINNLELFDKINVKVIEK